MICSPGMVGRCQYYLPGLTKCFITRSQEMPVTVALTGRGRRIHVIQENSRKMSSSGSPQPGLSVAECELLDLALDLLHAGVGGHGQRGHGQFLICQVVTWLSDWSRAGTVWKWMETKTFIFQFILSHSPGLTGWTWAGMDQIESWREGSQLFVDCGSWLLTSDNTFYKSRFRKWFVFSASRVSQVIWVTTFPISQIFTDIIREIVRNIIKKTFTLIWSSSSSSSSFICTWQSLIFYFNVRKIQAQ